MSVTTDYLLNKRIVLKQPAEGYRVAIDPVFLAAAVPNSAKSALDVGCGVGAAMLCAAARLPECHILGVEAQESLVALARENIDLAGWPERLSVVRADIADGRPAIENKKFDHVISNPPFYDPKLVTLSPNKSKRKAHAESTADLKTWLAFCLSALSSKGGCTLIYPTSGMGRLLSALHALKCSSRVFPLWAGVRKPAKRVIIQARKHASRTVDLLQGLTLHREDGRYTEEAEAVLRGGEELRLE